MAACIALLTLGSEKVTSQGGGLKSGWVALHRRIPFELSIFDEQRESGRGKCLCVGRYRERSVSIDGCRIALPVPTCSHDASGLRIPAASERAAKWILSQARHTRRIASVCTGIYGLARVKRPNSHQTTGP